MRKNGLLRLITLIAVCVLCLSLTAAAEEDTAFRYYYDQLTTPEARGIYDTLTEMLDNGDLKTGIRTVDLVQKNVLENRAYDKNALMADFSSARDAFMLDHSDIFYVDFTKLSITHTQLSSDDYSITMGLGRADTYYYDGFGSANVQTAIHDFDAQVAEIVELAQQAETPEAQLEAAYRQIVRRTSYALEQDAQPENVLYVRTPYGALVRGESVCEGYARALKAVLDQLGFDNVLVQGAYMDGGEPQPHMWNYVRMDDNLWYLLDATMERGADPTGESGKYFLLTGTDEALQYYQPDGVISLSAYAFEFHYPDLSAKAYEPMTTAFDSEVIDGITHISYKGMGVQAAADQGLYIVGSFDGKNWYFVNNYVFFVSATTYNDPSVFFADSPTVFQDKNMGFRYYAVTETVPPVFDENNPTNLANITHTGDYFDQSKLGEAIEYRVTAPVAVRREPANTRLDGGKEYTFQIIYSETLKLANAAKPMGMDWVKEVEGAELLSWSWDNDRTITLTFRTAVNYNFVTGYYFQPTNLVGVSSRMEPAAVGFTVVNDPSFACPKIEGDVSEVYANTPALIADDNLADNGWTDENGEPISKELPNRLSLVASTISGEEADELLGSLDDEVLSAQTFDISLGLCSNQIAYVTGKRVKVFVPFPAGYTAASENVTFKAYHFDADGNAEEIDCITTEHGIIMLCDRFSPYAIIATTGVNPQRKAILAANGSGTLDQELVTLNEGESAAVTIRAKEGYTIASLTLDGQPLEVTNSQTMELTLTHDQLSQTGSLLEATFTVKRFTTVDGDDIWNCIDAMVILDYISGKMTFVEEQKIVADYNHDNVINCLDAMSIMDSLVAS